MKGLIFTFALTFGGAIVSLYRPFVGLLIFICFGILRPESLWGFALPSLGYSRIIAIALLVGWVINGLGNWKFGQAKLVVFCLLGFWGWATIGAVQSTYQDPAWIRVEAMSKTLFPFVVGITLIESVKQLKQLAWLIVISQGYLAMEFNLSYWRGSFDPLYFEHGNLDNNGTAIIMVASAGFSFFLGMNVEKWWQKGIAFLAALFMTHYVLFSMSRGGIVTLGVTGLIAFVLLPKRPIHYLIFLIAALLVIRLTGQEVMERVMSTITFEVKGTRDESIDSRFRYWKAAWEGTLQNPIFGLGPDQWRLRCPEFGIPLGRAVHSTWFQVSVEHGLVGLMFYGLFYLFLILQLLPIAWGYTYTQDPAMRYLASMVIVAIVGFCISAQFVTMHGVDVPYCITLVGAGILKLRSSLSFDDDTAFEEEDLEYEEPPLPVHAH